MASKRPLDPFYNWMVNTARHFRNGIKPIEKNKKNAKGFSQGVGRDIDYDPEHPEKATEDIWESRGNDDGVLRRNVGAIE